MEIEITEFYNNADTRLYSNSVANSGSANIGVITWNNAQQTEYHFITEETRKGFLGYMEDCGMEDISEMSIQEANALFIQYLSGDIQEREMYDSWEDYQTATKEGQASGNLFEADGKIYYALDTSMHE